MITFQIPNMTCGGCARGVTAAIREADAAARVETDLAARTVAVESAATEAKLRTVLGAAGFAPV